jgi:hypothetical protein
MRKLNGFIGACALLLMYSTANAQIQIVIDNQTIPTEDIESIVILPNSNLISVTTAVAYSVTKTDSAPPAPDAVVISSFSAAPSTVVVNELTTLNWTTQNATSCTPSRGAAGWNTKTIAVPNGSDSFRIANANTYTFTLTCTGTNGDEAVRNLTVIVNEPSPDPDPTPTPSVTVCETAPLAGVNDTWVNFWGVNFPNPGYSNKNDIIPRSGYVSYEFNTGTVIDSGLIVTVGNTLTSGVRLGAISECPGQFDVAPECDHVWGLGGGITWASNGKSGACQLKPNTTYYLNLTFTDGFDPKSTTCTTSNCVATLQHVNR